MIDFLRWSNIILPDGSVNGSVLVLVAALFGALMILFDKSEGR